jgi:hypothetical protein
MDGLIRNGYVQDAARIGCAGHVVAGRLKRLDRHNDSRNRQANGYKQK